MARLKSRGRTELVRLVRELPGDDGVFWRKRFIALMSDRVILKKDKVWFKPNASWESANGRLHDWGWKVFGKAKSDTSVDSFTALFEKSGYSVE